MYGPLDIAAVFLLSAIPFIESRGAMFYGFSVGITDLWVYAACVIVNIAQAYAYPGIFAGLLSGKKPLLSEAAKRLKGKIGSVASPSFFLLAIPMFGNGINTFSSTLISVWLGLKGYQKYVAGGVILRGALTFAILSGASFLQPYLAQAALKLLLCGYALYATYSARGWLAKKFGLESRKAPDGVHIAAGVLLLAFSILLLAQNDIAAPLSQFFSLFYYSSSPGKMISFFVFLAAASVAKAFLQPVAASAGKADRGAFFYLFVPLAALCLIGLGITSYYAADARGQLGEFNLGQRAQYALFAFDEKDPLGISLTSFRENHNHALKAAAFLPVLSAFPELDQKYAMSINFYYRLPFLLLVLLFAAIAFLALAMIASCCRFSGWQFAFLAALSYLALAGSIDAGMLSPPTLAAMAGLAIISLKRDARLSGAMLLAVFFFSIDSGLAPGIGALHALRGIAFASGFYFAYAGKKPGTAVAFAIAAALGWPDDRAIALMAAAFLSTFLLGRRVLYDAVALGALAFAMYLETWALPIGTGHSLMPIFVSAAALAAGKGASRLALALVLAFSIFASMPAYQAEYFNNNFDRQPSGQVAIYAGWQGSPVQAAGEPFIILNGPDATLRSFGLKLPEIYRHELVCFPSNSLKPMKTYISADAPCSGLFGDSSGEIGKEAAETTVLMRFHAGNRGNCIVESASTGLFSGCRAIQYWAFQNSSRIRNATGVIASRLPGSVQQAE